MFKGQDIIKTIDDELEILSKEFITSDQMEILSPNPTSRDRTPRTPTLTSARAGGDHNTIDKQIKELLKSEAKYERALGIPKDE